MPNEFPISPEVLAEAGAYSLNDLSIMNVEEMSPAAEIAYIEELRAYRERYERALGQTGSKRGAGSTAKKGNARASIAKVILDGPIGDTTDVEF